MKSGVDEALMKEELADFSTPNTQEKGKALVYFIYRDDLDTFAKIVGLNPGVKIYAAASSESKNSKHNNQAFVIANIFALGALRDTANPDRKLLGDINPGQFLSLNLNPGTYEFTRELKTKKDKLLEGHPVHMEVIADKIYYIVLKADSFLNRYAGAMQHGIFMNKTSDELNGQYILMKNFAESKVKNSS